MYDIEYTLEAIADLKPFRKYERQLIVDQIAEQLSYEPAHETRNRKRLRPNSVAGFELRIKRFRIFYDVDENKILLRLKPSAIKTAAVCSSAGRNTNYENY